MLVLILIIPEFIIIDEVEPPLIPFLNEETIALKVPLPFIIKLLTLFNFIAEISKSSFSSFSIFSKFLLHFRNYLLFLCLDCLLYILL